MFYVTQALYLKGSMLFYDLDLVTALILKNQVVGVKTTSDIIMFLSYGN